MFQLDWNLSLTLGNFLRRSPPYGNVKVIVTSIWPWLVFVIYLIGVDNIFYFYCFLDSKSIKADMYIGVDPTIKSLHFSWYLAYNLSNTYLRVVFWSTYTYHTSQILVDRFSCIFIFSTYPGSLILIIGTARFKKLFLIYVILSFFKYFINS